MTDPRISEIRNNLNGSYSNSDSPPFIAALKDLSWLLGEVERLNKYVAICKEMAELIDRELEDDRLSSLGFTIAHNLLSDYKEITG